MGYRADLDAAARWLVSVQRPDGGWGLTAGQASSVVNTAEALYVLRCSRRFEVAQERAARFITTKVFSHIETIGPRVRYAAFALFGLSLVDESKRSDDVVARCRSWLLEAKNDDGAWGMEARDNASTIFSTYLALWTLRQSGCEKADLTSGYQWLLAQAMNEGWALPPRPQPSPVATAYAVLALAGSNFGKSDRLDAAHKFLLQTRQWGTEEEVIPGTVWKHCTFASVVPALMRLGELPYSATVANAIVAINRLRSDDGGWSETEPGVGRTVRAQFWSVLALESVDRAFDPAIHVLRLDQERTGATLSEPDFVTINALPRYVTILPARVYRLIAYVSLVAAATILAGAHRYFEKLPARADALAALGLFTLAHLLIHRRPKQFPRAARIMKWIVAAVSLVGLVFGTDLASIAQTAQDVVVGVTDKLQSIRQWLSGL